MSNGIWTDSLRIPLIIAEPGRRAQGRRTGPDAAAPGLRACVISPAGRATPGTHARRVTETPKWLRHEGAPAPCDRTPQTPHADPTGDMTQALTGGVR
ncbi:hypothetical protein GCM10022420_053250 [Streptomyces iranensis]